MRFLRIIAMSLIAILVIGIYIWFRVDYERGELKKYGRFTKGLIIDHHEKRGLRSKLGDRAVVRYVIDGKEFIKEVRDNKFRYHVGDSVYIKYSSEDPAIFRVVSKENKVISTPR